MRERIAVSVCFLVARNHRRGLPPLSALSLAKKLGLPLEPLSDLMKALEAKGLLVQVAGDHSSDWQGLGVAILHRLIIETLLEAPQLPKPRYVHQVEEVVESLMNDDQDEFPLAALVMPASLEHIRLISEHNERMPAKSTYFYPKLLSGLVLNPLF